MNSGRVPSLRIIQGVLLLVGIVLGVFVIGLEWSVWGPVGVLVALVLIAAAIRVGVMVGERVQDRVLLPALMSVPPAPRNVRLVVEGEIFPLELVYNDTSDEGLDKWVATSVPAKIDLTKSIEIKADEIPEHTWIQVGHVSFHV
jgi:hypothetical protein